jgi:hypothetical protein
LAKLGSNTRAEKKLKFEPIQQKFYGKELLISLVLNDIRISLNSSEQLFIVMEVL